MPRPATAQRQVPLETGSVDLATRRVTRDGADGPTLTPTETALFEHLVRNAGQTVPRADLLRDVWGYREGVRTRTVDTTMRRLRRKIEQVPGVPRHLLTEEGVGYRFVPLSELSLDTTGQGPLDPTVGRDDELALLDRLAGQGARLVSIVGPGGVGKTRLAREWVRNKKVLEVPLGDVDGTSDVLGAIAAAASTNPVSLAELATRLSHRGVEWVLLDNVEHLLPEVGAMARALACTELRVLVTSRCALKVAGDTRVDLVPLDALAGATLLRTRAPMALGSAEDSVLADIVERVDGLPLALEMAAARAPLLGARGLRDRLSKPLNVLGLTEAGDQQRTLRSVARWSWELLPEPATRALACLAVFRGGFTVEAAEAVVGQPDGLDLLQVLRDQSWLRRRSGPDGWRLDLLVPLRDFVREHAGDNPDAELRHARHFATWGADSARDAAERDDGERRRMLVADWPNLLRAIEVGLSRGEAATAAGAACAAWDVTRIGRPPSVLIPLVMQVLVQLPAESPWRYRMLIALADLRRSETDPTAPLALAEEGRELARLAADLRWAARGFAVGGVIAQEHCDYDISVPMHEAALALARTAGDRRLEGLVLSNLGNLRQRQGRLDDARTQLEAAIALFDAHGYQRHAAVARGNLGVVWHDLGELELAETCYQRALRTHEAHNNQRYIGLIHGNLGELALDRGDPRAALAPLAKAAATHRTLGDPRLESVVRLSESEAARLLGDRAFARELALDSGSLARRAGAQMFVLSADAMLAELSDDADPVPALRRIVASIRGLDAMGVDVPTHITRCRLVRAWSRSPRVAPAEIGLTMGISELVDRVRAFTVAHSISRRSELGRHLSEALDAVQAADLGHRSST